MAADTGRRRSTQRARRRRPARRTKHLHARRRATAAEPAGTRPDPSLPSTSAAGTAPRRARCSTSSHADPRSAEPLVPGLPYVQGRGRLRGARTRWPAPSTTCSSRRTRARLLGARRVGGGRRAVAALIAPELGWDEPRRRAGRGVPRARSSTSARRPGCPRPRSTRHSRRRSSRRAQWRRIEARRRRRSRSAATRRRDGAPRGARSSRSTTRCCERLRGACADVTDRCRRCSSEASRDWWPLAMIWALDDQVAARARVVVRPRSADEVAAVLRVCNDARVPVTAAAGRSGVCGASVPVFGGVLLDLCALAGIVDVDDDVDARRRAAGHVRRRASRTSCATSTASPSGTGRSRWRSRPSAAGSRAGAPGSLDALREDRGHRRRPRRRARRRHASSRPAARPAPRSAPTSRSSSSAPRARSASSSAPGCACIPCRRPSSRAAFGVHVVRRRARRHAADRAARRHARGAAPLRRDRRPTAATRPATRARAARARRGRRARSSRRRMRIVARGVRSRATRSTSALVERWLGHRNDVSALEALIARGYVVDTMEIAGPWRDAARRSTTRRPRRSARSSTRWSRPRTRATRTPTARASTSRSRASRRPTSARRTTAPRGTRARGRCSPRGGALSHHHGVGLNRARFVPDALGDGFDVLVAVKDALDPNGILNPGKLGLAEPVRRQSPGRERVTIGRVLVVDVGTSSVRAAVVDADGAVVAEHARELLPDSPADGLVEFDAAAMARRASTSRAPRSTTPGPSTRSASPNQRGVDRRVGPRDRRARRARARLAGPAHDRRVPRAARRRASASRRTSRRPRCSGSSTQLDARPRAATSASAPSTRGSRGRSRTARCT